MSNILKGILNETSPHDYDSDWDYQDAVARSGKSRSSYRSQEDDTFDADVAYSKKMYQLGQQQKAAKEKAQRDSDHDRLATGTNEDITETSNPYEPVMIQGYDKWLKLVNIPNVDKHAYKSDITAVTSLGDVIGEFNTDKDLGYVIKKYVKKGMTEAGTGLDIDRSIPGRTIARISGDIKHRTGSGSTKKLPDYHPDDDYDQWSGKVGPSIHDDEEDTFDTDYTGDEDGTLKEISNEKLGQYKTAAALDAGKADKEGDYKRADKRFSGIVKATKKQFANDTKQSAIGQGVAEEIRPTTGQAMNIRKQTTKKMNSGNKFVWKRPNQINGSHTEQELLSMGFKKSTKYNMWGGTQDMWNRLSSELDENLGDQLKSKSLEALTLLKQQIEQKRAEDLAQWEQDFRNNVANKMRNQSIRSPEATPVAQPGEKHSVLKARLAQLNSAIEKQALLDKLVDKLERKGLMTPAMQNDTDTRMHVRYGAKDNYQSLNQKLDNAIATLQNRLDIRKKSGLKEEPISEDDSVTGRMRMNDYYELADAIQEKLRHAIQMGDKARIQELYKQRDELDARVKKHGMMPEDIAEEQLDELSCWSGYHRVAGTKAGFPGSCAKNKTNEDQHSESCPHCGGEMVSEELMNEKKDACYYKVKSRYKVWPSAYASGALVKCRNKGASNWGNSSKNESSILEGINRADESLHDWFNKEKWVRMDTKGKIKGPCAREPGEGKPKCLPQAKAHSLGKKGRASAAQRKRREDPNPERSGKAINVNTKKQSNENIDEGWKKRLGAAALTGAMALGAAGASADNTRRVTPDGQGGFTGGMKPTATVQAEPATTTPSTTIPGQGLVRAEHADRQAGTVTVDGQEYKMIMLEPGGIRPRGGQQIVIPQAVMGERGMGNYMAILAGGRVFVLPRNE